MIVILLTKNYERFYQSIFICTDEKWIQIHCDGIGLQMLKFEFIFQ